jgi:hypothetical protein
MVGHHPPEIIACVRSQVEKDYLSEYCRYLIEKRLPGTWKYPDIQVYNHGELVCVVEIGNTDWDKLFLYDELKIPDIRWYGWDGRLQLGSAGYTQKPFRDAIHKVLYEGFGAEYPISIRHEAVEWFNEERNRIRKSSLRGLETVMNYINRNADNQTNKQKALRLLLHWRPIRNIPSFDVIEIARVFHTSSTWWKAQAPRKSVAASVLVASIRCAVIPGAH